MAEHIGNIPSGTGDVRATYLPDPVKAFLFIVDPTRGFRENFIEFSANPSELQRVESVVWAGRSSPGSAGSDYQYIQGGDRKIKVKLYLDALDISPGEGGVFRDMSRLELLTYPHSREGEGLLDSQFLGPPSLLFCYGDRVWEVVIETIKLKEHLHNHLLEPIFVEVDITMKVDLLFSEVNEGLHTWRRNQASR